MYEQTFRNRVVESNLSLPFMVAITILLWATGPVQEVVAWVTLVLVGITTYTIVEWNNQCQLLRVRSRMNSVLFLSLTVISPTLLGGGLTLVPALCLLWCYFAIFKGYGIYRPQGYLFHGFLFLALGSIVYPPLLLVAPTLLVSCRSQLRALTFKPFVASLLGLALPYWFYAAAVSVLSYAGGLSPVAQQKLENLGMVSLTWHPWTKYFTLSLPDFSTLTAWQWSVFAVIILLGVRSVIHFISTSYNDKIRTRQYFYTMLLQLLPLLAVTVCLPQDARYTLPLLTLGVTPFAAHYLAQGRGNNMHYRFIFWIIAFVTIGAMGHLDLWETLLSCDIRQCIPQTFNPVEIWNSFFN